MSDTALTVTLFGLIVALVLIPIVYVFGPMGYRAYVTNQVLNNGLPATAVVTSLDDTGNRINEQPVIRMTLHVTPPNAPAFDATIQRVITVANYAGLAPGSHVRVKYNPNNHGQVAIIYGAP